VWQRIDYIPLWVLRSIFVVVGFIAGVGVAGSLYVFIFASRPQVTVTFENNANSTAEVHFDDRPADVLRGSAKVSFTDNSKGTHTVGLRSNAADGVAVDFQFRPPSWGSDFSIKLQPPVSVAPGP
jgi:hypothetical protein